MTAPSPLAHQLLRRKPTAQLLGHSHGGEHSGPDLTRTIGTFQLTMFGVGATIGTGIAAGLSAICYAELASTIPVSGSTYSYATLGEMVAMGVAACLLLEYGVSTAAVAVGWSQYIDQLLRTFFGGRRHSALNIPGPGLHDLMTKDRELP